MPGCAGPRAMRICSTLATASLIWLTSPWNTAHAFESSEHCSLSNFALMIALDRAIASNEDQKERARLATYKTTFAPDPTQCFPKNWFRPGKIAFSYGKITALVDAQNTLDDVFLRYGGVLQGVESPQDLSETYFGDKAWLLGRFTLAGHNNISHFQGLLMSSFARWHESAVIAARGDGNLFQALAAHAIADHFLQDFFAPGHVVTARDNLPDVVALSWHDRYNNSGLPVIVQNWSEIRELAEFAVTKAKEADSIWDTAFVAIAGESSQPDPAQVAGAIARALATLEAADDDVCPSDKRRNYAASSELLQAINAEHRLKPTDEFKMLCMYGDGKLGSSEPAIADRVAAQKLLMSIIQARYILDVIDAYHGKGTEHSFPAYTFCPQMTSRSFSWADADNRAEVGSSADAAEPTARISCERQLQLAEQSLPENKRAEDFVSCFGRDDKCTPTYAAPVAITRYAAYVLDAAPTKRFFEFDPVFALSASFKSGSSNTSNGVWGLETLPIGLVGARDYVRDRDFRDLGVPNMGLALGYEGALAGSGNLDHAYTGRLIWALPRLDMQISAYGKKMYLENSIRRHNAWGYGLRFETGFSLLTVFLSFGREPLLDGAQASSDEVFGAGIAFSISGRRALTSINSMFD